MDTRVIKPYAMLHTQGRRYFVLSPHPLERAESWERDNAYRFAVVPTNVIAHDQETQEEIFSYSRHVVTTAFVLEYSPDLPVIRIQDHGEYDLSKVEWMPEMEIDFSEELFVEGTA